MTSATTGGTDPVIVWATVIAALGAVATALSVGFGAIQLRRRPEVEVRWYWDDDLWDPDDIKSIGPNEGHKLGVVARNVGDATGYTTKMNLIAADVFRLNIGATLGQPSGNAIAGRHTNNAVTYLARDTIFTINFTWIINCGFAMSRNGIHDQVHEVVFIIEDDRFNSSGKRWLPTLTRSLDEHAAVGRKWRRIGARPGTPRRKEVKVGKNVGTVVCGPGYRRATRRVRINAPGSPP